MDRLIILLVVLVACFFYFKPKAEGFNNCTKNTIYHFLNKVSSNKYSDIVKEFGDPDVFHDEPNGAAIWNGHYPFVKIMLLDEAVGHMEPYPHCDFLYATIRVHIPDSIMNDVMNLSKSMYYDRVKKELTVRCYSMGANVATLWLAVKMISNPDKINVIGKEFSSAISASESNVNYKKMLAELSKMIEVNQTTYSEQLEKRECVVTYGAGQSSSLIH